MKKLIPKIIWPLLTAAFMVMIFLFSAQGAVESSENSSGIVDLLVELFIPRFDSLPEAKQETLTDALTFVVRKSAHMAEYAVLAVLFWKTASAWGLLPQIWVRAMAAWGATVLYAVSDELHQRLVPGRSGEIRDVLIDGMGALLGVLCILLLKRIAGKWKGRKNKR